MRCAAWTQAVGRARSSDCWRPSASACRASCLHPGLGPRFFLALETPIRITETGGGSADWNFARIQLLRNGTENERHELGADVIERAGYKKITARSNNVYTLVFRTTTGTSTTVRITLGFARPILQ
jgi:hypothetical protein